MRKRLLSTLLAFAMMLTLLPGTAWAAGDPVSLTQTDYASTGSDDTGRNTGELESGLFRLIYVGDWDGLGLPNDYQEIISYQFREIYPKLIARWGYTGTEARTVMLYADPDYSGVAATSSRARIRVSSAYMQQNQTDVGFYTHELMHIVQGYGSFQSSWWTENFADYVRFRYFACVADGSWSEKTYSENDSAVRDWDWQPYGKCAWFFAYLDARYPTRKLPDGSVKLGLIDTINIAIKKGELTDDGGKDHSSESFNAIVEDMTGYRDMELLRQQYVRELDKGTWRFEGFDDYEDNFLTEEVSAEVSIVRMGDNLLANASVHDFQGLNHPDFSPAMLIDENIDTNWQCGLAHGDAYPYIVLDMGESKEFDSYSLLSYYSNCPTAWELLVSNDASVWRYADYQAQQNFTNASYNIGTVSGRYVMLRIIPAANGPILYELMLFDNAISSDGSSTRYTISAPISVTGGSTELSSDNAVRGATITIAVTPDDSYNLDTLAVIEASGKALMLTKVSDTLYTFTMPASPVTVSATFAAIDTPWINSFTDISESDWFYDGVAYAARNGLMQGVGDGKFNPSDTTTRGMIVTILYRLEGKPTVSQPTFADVAAGQYYTEAVAWAAANKIVDGYGNNTFGPNDNITREQMVTILYRYAVYKGYNVSGQADLSSYADIETVSDWALTAIRWANSEGLITGRTTTTLVPKGTATRAEVATILARFCRSIAGLE